MAERGRPRKLPIPFETGSREYARAYYALNRVALQKKARDRERVRRGLDVDHPGKLSCRRRPKRETAWASLLRRNIRNAARARGIAWDPALTSAWIRAQFERQCGRCFYTGIPFVLEIQERVRGMRRPSLDRRDSRHGYTPDNTVLCLTAINYLKNDYTETDTLALLDEIRRTIPPSA